MQKITGKHEAKKRKTPHRLLALLLAVVLALSLAPSSLMVAIADDSGTVELTS